MEIDDQLLDLYQRINNLPEWCKKKKYLIFKYNEILTFYVDSLKLQEKINDLERMINEAIKEANNLK